MSGAATQAREAELALDGDPLRLVQALRHAGLLGDYVLYADHAGGEVRIGCNALARVTVGADTISVVSAPLGLDERVAARAPIEEAGARLQALPLPRWTAYGYFAFDLARFYFPYHKAVSHPLLHLVVPETELRCAGGRLHVRTVGDVDAIAAIARSLGRADGGGGARWSPPALRDRDDYCGRVAALVDSIRRGRLRKAILSRRVEIARPLDELSTYAGAREANNAARSFAFRLGEVRGAGFSPELFLEASADGRVVTNPLAGTRPRGGAPDDDGRLHAELFSDAKEVKEHAISILLAQEEMQSVCTRESLRIHDFMEVKRFRWVQHLSSRVGGQLAPGRTTWDAIRALFPGVTVSGISKQAALDAIDRLEEAPRGVYGGAVGWVDSTGAADLAIAIRSVYAYAGTTCLNAGAGIVAESKPDAEYEESVNKMKTMLSQVVLEGA